nr:MAG TPA: hypothetical protein [Caudoviricetes sp.]
MFNRCFSFFINRYWIKKNEKMLTFERFILSKSCLRISLIF